MLGEKTMKTVFLFLAVILLVSCGSQTSKTKLPKEAKTLRDAIVLQKHNPHKAIVFAKLYSDDAYLGVSQEVFGFLAQNDTVGQISFVGSFGNLKETLGRTLSVGGQQVKLGGINTMTFTERKNWAYVEPGKYAVNYYHSTDNLRANISGWSRDDGKAYMVFNISPGDVVYIGDIYAGLNENQVSVVVKDNYESTLNNVPEALKTTLQKRLIAAPKILTAESVTPYRNERSTTSFPVYRAR